MADTQIFTGETLRPDAAFDLCRLGLRARWGSITMGACAFFCLAAMVVLFTGCRSGIPEPVPDLPLRQASVEELMTMLNQRSDQIQSLRALVQLHGRGKIIPIRSSMNMSVSYVRPSLIRLRAFDPLGRTLFDLTSNQMQFRVHLPTQNRVVAGTHSATSADPPSEMSSMRQRFLHLVSAVSKTVLATPIDDSHHVTLYEEGLLYRIEVMETPHSSHPVRQLWVERINFDVVKDAVLSATGDPIITVEFDDYRSLGPRGQILYPFHMSIHDVVTDSHYTLIFQEVLPNPEVGPTEFDMSRMFKKDASVAFVSRKASTHTQVRLASLRTAVALDGRGEHPWGHFAGVVHP
ncbi:MAG: hypothetical protein CMH81_08550 [Nitrospiraceae bacterium]|nr:hypothetical protein [Nitrospiraceae bacterium]|tara:strand:- start:3696 stop:4742 length:1047 start_codon:yes stop_codon:yes gene_type:complete